MQQRRAWGESAQTIVALNSSQTSFRISRARRKAQAKSLIAVTIEREPTDPGWSLACTTRSHAGSAPHPLVSFCYDMDGIEHAWIALEAFRVSAKLEVRRIGGHAVPQRDTVKVHRVLSVNADGYIPAEVWAVVLHQLWRTDPQMYI